MNNQHPEHEYSKYIDNDFSFSNIVYPTKVDLADTLKNVRCDGGIMLEPRLQEYLKKKKHYKENNIKPCIKLEDEFLITDRDMKILRSFLRGKKDMYDSKKYQKIYYTDNKSNDESAKKYFPSKEYRDNDPRVQVLKRPSTDRPSNMGMFVPEINEAYYEERSEPIDGFLDTRDMITGFELNNQRFDPRVDPVMNPGFETNDKYTSQYRIDPFNTGNYDNGRTNRNHQNKKENKKTHQHGKNSSHTNPNFCARGVGKRSKCKAFNDDSMGGYMVLGGNNESSSPSSGSDYASFSSFGDGVEGGAGSGNESMYGNINNPGMSYKSDMDTDLKVVVPSISSNDKRGMSTWDYTLGPYIGQQKPVMDADLETSMIRGMPSHTMKSYGYRNPEEHYFQYIDDDFQNPDNSDLPFPRGGESTRRNNKALAKQRIYRKVM